MKIYQKILIVQTAYLGDLVLTTPLFRAVRQLFPDSIIDALVIPQTADLIRNNTNLSHIYTFDKRNNREKAFAETLNIILKQQYDLAITPHRSFTTLRMLLASGIPRRIGFRTGIQSFLLTDRVKYRQDQSEIQRNLSLLSPLSKRTFDIQTEIFLSLQSRQTAESVLSDIPAHHYRIALAPGSVWPTKRWPQEHFAQVLSQLSNEPVSFILIGSPAEKQLCQSIIDQSNCKHALNTAGTSLLEAAALIKGSNLFIGNDSGTLHIANAVQTDVIAFFGPTDESLGFFPFRPDDKVFQIDLDCRPCSKHGAKSCPLGHFKCMKTLYPEPVIIEIKKRLKKSVPGR